MVRALRLALAFLATGVFLNGSDSLSLPSQPGPSCESGGVVVIELLRPDGEGGVTRVLEAGTRVRDEAAFPAGERSRQDQAQPELACPTLPWDYPYYTYNPATQLLDISWPAPTGADAGTVYQIYAFQGAGYCSSSGPETLVAETSSLSSTVWVPLNRSYNFHIKVKNCSLYNPGGSNSNSYWGDGTFAQQAAAAAILSATSAGTTVTVSHTLASDQFAYLGLERSADGVTWTPLGGVIERACPAGATGRFTVQNQPPGTQRYRLRLDHSDFVPDVYSNVVSTVVGCTYSLTSSGAQLPAGGASGQTFGVTTATGCAWTAVSNNTWITVTGGASGSGSGTVTYSVASNTGGSSRVGTITAGGQTFTVTQAGCTYVLAPSSASIPVTGASGQTFAVTAGTGCTWTAVSNNAWITVTGGASGSGNGTVTYSVASNTGGSSRVGTITAGGQTFTVTQAGCTYSVDPAGTSIPASGASNLRFSVVTAAGCPWTASSGQAWIVLQSGSSGSGPGPVTYSVGPNGSPQSRSGQITVAGVAVFSINQAGFNCPEIAIEPASLNRAVKGLDYSAVFSATGGTSPYVWSQTGTLPPGMTFEGGTLSGVPTETGTFSLTVVATDARGCPGSRSTSLEVVECVPPPAPVFTSSPGGEVTAGSPVTVSWTAALGQDATGHYELQVSENGACANPRTIETRAPFATIPTTSGVSATLCFRVRAVSGQGCSSSFSGPLLSTVRAAPAEFVVVAAAPAQTVEKGAALPSNVEVVIRNIGSATGSLSVSSNGPLFEPSPRGFGSVRPGEDVRVDVVFSPGASAEPGLKTANLVAAWLEGGIPRTLASPVSLTVLEGAPIDSRGSRLQFFPANQFSFRQAGSGNPPPQQVTVVNTGESPVRLASRIGPGGGWLSVGGDFSSVLSPGATREFTVAVDRRKRSSSDGPPPLVTGLIIVNVDGNPEDSAYAQVIDEEPPAPAPAPGRPVLKEGEFSLILGSAVNAPGSGGTAFISDGWIRNQGSSEEAVDLYWTPGGEDGLSGGGVRKNRLSIAGYASYRLSDLVGSLFQTSNVSGQVEIRSTRLAQLSVRATTDSIRSLDDVIARYGTEIPLVVSGSGVGKGPKTRQPQLARQPQVARSGTASVGDAIVLIPGIRDSHAGYRTNLHFAETTGKEATVLARVYDVEGSPVGEKLVYVPAYSKSQVNSTDVELFGTGKRFDGGTVEVLPKIGSGTVAVFATVIDNASQSFATRAGEVFRVNDALRAVSRAPSPRSAEPAFIPAATRSVAANDSFYTTRVTIANIARVAISLTATYLPDKKYQQASIARRITIPPRAEGPRAVVFQDVVTELFEITQDSAGMVKLEGDLAPLTVASETSTPIDPKNPSRGRSLSALNPAPCKPEGDPFGVYSPSATEVVGTEASGSSASIVTLPAIEEGYAFRTNLILAELAGEPLVVKVRLVRPGSGAAIGEKVYPLDRNERLQINRVIRDVLQVDSGAADFQDIQVEIHAVEGKGRVLALVTKIDNNPSSKRADIFTLGGACGGSPLSPGN